MSDENLKIKAMFVAAAFNALLTEASSAARSNADPALAVVAWRHIPEAAMDMGQKMLDEFRKQEGWP